MKNRILRGFRAHILVIVATLAVAATVIISPAASAQTVAVVHVDGQNGSASPAGLGDDWGSNHGYKYLQDGLVRADTLLALPVPPDRVEVWVIGNTTNPYRPDQSAANQSGTNNRNATFAMRVDVRVYGGFDAGDSQLSHADPVTNVTVLTGEINNSGEADNSHHVVTADDAGMDEDNCRVDGFTVTLANAESSGGGGISISNSADLRVDRCKVTGNYSGDGGYGAGIKVYGSNPVITRCVISNNQNLDGETLYGGGIVVYESSGTSNNPVRILDCTISGNRAAHGGGISVKNTSYALIVNCLITGNQISGAPNNAPLRRRHRG